MATVDKTETMINKTTKLRVVRNSTTVTIWNWYSLLTILIGPQVPSQFTKRRYLPMELCDVFLRTNRVMCALNMEILDLLYEKSFSGARINRASL